MSGDLLNTLILLSEKAANIARICRQDRHLLSLLVQEKVGDEKNPRFVQDFKTFADVLVQEVVKHHVENSFSELKGNVLGEESNTFKREEEDCITVEVKEVENDTEELIYRVLQDRRAAEILSKEVHRTDTSQQQVILPHHSLPNNIALWIDPIDSTAEYIHGNEEETGDVICQAGVQCVTVLLGVFSKETGEPLLGVINQPFFSYNNNKWTGRSFYGICSGESRIFGPQVTPNSQSKLVVVSSSESGRVKGCLSGGGYTVIEAAGAGYKGLAVVTGLSQAYVLSKGSTYPWDICSVHAILCSLGGGIVDFTTRLPLKYSNQPKPNSGGLIAYRHPDVLQHIVSLLDELQ